MQVLIFNAFSEKTHDFIYLSLYVNRWHYKIILAHLLSVN